MIYDKANFYFHFSPLIVFFTAAFQLGRKSRRRKCFRLVRMENGKKIEENVDGRICARETLAL